MQYNGALIVTGDGVGGGGGAINQKSFGATISKNIKRFWLNIKWSNQAFYVASVGGGVCFTIVGYHYLHTKNIHFTIENMAMDFFSNE